MEQPKVTFIIANYNYGKYLQDAIESAVNQEYPKSKLRVNFIDDCSTDDSKDKLLEIIQKSENCNKRTELYENCEVYSCLYKGVELNVFLCQSNNKQAHARNISINYSLQDTDLFAILDADDINYKNKISRLSLEWSLNPDFIGAVYADYHTLNVENNLMSYEYKKPYDKMVLNRECIVHSGSLISKKALIECKENNWFFDPSMPPCEDYDMWMRISEKFLIIHIPEPHSLVRIHKQNCTYTISNDKWRQQVTRVYTKAAKRYEK